MSIYGPSYTERRETRAAVIQRRIAALSGSEMIEYAAKGDESVLDAMVKAMRDMEMARAGMLLHSAVVQGFREEVEDEVKQWAEEYENAQRRKYETPA